MSALTVVMYHYVRPLKDSRYPGIKGLELQKFKEQIRYFGRFYRFVSIQDCLSALAHQRILPDHSLLLTFDDGLSDHFNYVFPFLNQLSIPAAFFPPAAAIQERRLLDAHKLHFVLASVRDYAVLIDYIFGFLRETTDVLQRETQQELFARLAQTDRFDPKEISFAKRLLQQELPSFAAERLLNELYTRFVQVTERALANELYLSMDQLRLMNRFGMHIGSHGYEHRWLDSLSPKEQEQDIQLSLRFLSDLGVSHEKWVMCYPYGGYNSHTLDLLRNHDCGLGLTTEVRLAELNNATKLVISRLDTNDFPTDGDANPNEWTKQVLTQSAGNMAAESTGGKRYT